MEVRFFGGYHRKALVERHHIKPISTNVHSLQIKRTSEWNKASEELKRYQELHDKYKDKPEFLTDQYGDPFDGEKVKYPSRQNTNTDFDHLSGKSADNRVW